MYFIFFFSFLVLLRIAEMIISRRNEKWLVAHGGIEYGRRHFPFLIGMHVLFLGSLLAEYLMKGASSFEPLFLGVFILLTILKLIVVAPLGRYWTAKIYRVPGHPLIRKGLYKYFRHPNYVIVAAEIAVIPLTFHLYVTAIVFYILNAFMLFIRIREEDKALRD